MPLVADAHDYSAVTRFNFLNLNACVTLLGAVYKRRPQSEGASPVRTFFRQGEVGVLQTIFWCKRTSDIFKFMMCPHRQGGLK